MGSVDNEFVHLHVHTDYSLLDGCCRIDRLCSQAQHLGMKALSITDHGNLFGLPDFFQTAKKYDLKPLLGCEIYLVYDHKMTARPERGQHKYYHMGLLAQNIIGYHNLTRLVSDAHMHGMYYKPRTDMEQLAEHAEGLIGFTGCLQGVVPQFLLQEDYQRARQAMGEFISIFGREHYFVEIQDHGLQEQQRIVPDLVKLAREFRVKIICSNDVHYVSNTDWQSHDALVCIQTGAKIADEKRLRYSSRQFYLKSRQEMDLLFPEYPEAIINTCTVAEQCELELPFGKNHYPIFQLCTEDKAKFSNNTAYLKNLCVKGLQKRYGIDYANPNNSATPDKAQLLCQRMGYELSIIEQSGFIDYFLIVWDFIDWARKQGISVGPGRGSGAGCLVAYLLQITDIDPIRFGLFFERFLNPERVSPPDFDIDFCVRRRSEVIDYVRKKYGAEAVANIITFGTFGAKMVIRDLARVLDVSYAEGDRLAKMIPDDPKITIDNALERSKELRQETERNEVANNIVEQGRIIEGMVRNTGTHAAGIIIADRPIIDYVPVTLQEGALTTQFPKDPVEALGLLKMDFLGLKTLTVIADTENNIRQTRNQPDFNIEAVGFEDAKTFKLLNDAKTVGIFQLESGGMQSLCRQFSISNIDEIVALIALYRPGPMDWIPDYIRGKKDPSTIKFPHPLLEDICKETYGVMVYQEQVMEAARLIAGYSLGKADILRRAMGKKKVKEMERQRAVFVEGAQKHNNIDKGRAEAIFAILEKFAGYGFNKSHSAAYAILAYRTAYLKANYPVEFMAAVLSNELGNADKVAHFIEECAVLSIPVLGPDVNESRERFTPIIAADPSVGSIRFGLGAIKGVGDAAATHIIAEREKNGSYKDAIDFVLRIDNKQANRRVLESLVKSGSFDSMGVDRQHLLDSLEGLIAEAISRQKDRETGQTSFFDLLDGSDGNSDSFRSAALLTTGPTLAKNDGLLFEKELLGFYLSGHPMDDYGFLSTAINSFEQHELQRLEDRESFRLAGVVTNINKRISKRDNRQWAFFTLATQTHNVPLNIFPEAYETYGNHVAEGNVVVVNGSVRRINDEVRLNVQNIGLLENRLAGIIRSLTWTIDLNAYTVDALAQVADYIHTHEGQTPSVLQLRLADKRLLTVQIAQSLKCQPLPQQLAQLRQHPAILDIRAETSPLATPELSHWQRKKAVAS